MAEEQGIRNLKITGRKKIPIYPADWIAGVEYEQGGPNDMDSEQDDKAYEPHDEDVKSEDYADDYELEYDKIDHNEIDELFADDDRADNEEGRNENADLQQDEDDGSQEDEEIQPEPTQ